MNVGRRRIAMVLMSFVLSGSASVQAQRAAQSVPADAGAPRGGSTPAATCVRDAQCVLVGRSCCGPCSGDAATFYRAVMRRSSTFSHYQDLCQRVRCPRCYNAALRDARAVCEAGRCVVRGVGGT